MQIEIVTQPSFRAATVRHVGPYDQIGEAFGRLSTIAAEAGLFAEGSYMLGLYHDDPRTVAAGELRSDAAITLKPSVSAPEGSKEMTIPAGRYARGSYTGPYSGLPAAWNELMTWLGGRDDSPGEGMSYELYRNDPTDTAPEDLITEIYMPLVG
jgi:AraC family transcriptional regulator